MALNKVFVGNLSFRTVDSALAQFFEPAGKVVSTNIITRGPRSLGYGFIEFETEDEARTAVNTLNKKQLDTREINVELAKPRVERPRNTDAPRGNYTNRGRRPRGPNRSAQNNNNNSDQNNDQNNNDSNNAQNNEASGNDAQNPQQGRSPVRRNNNRRRYTRPRDQQGQNQNQQGQNQNQGQNQPQEGEQRPRGRQQSQGQSQGKSQSNSQNQAQGQPQSSDSPSRGLRRGRRGQRGGGRGRGRGFFERPPRTQNRTESTTSLFVANLPFDLTDEKLLEHFKEFNATKAHVVTNYQSRSRGFGFVEFESEKDQNAAFTTTNQNKIVISERPLTVKIALLDDRPPRPDVESAGPETNSTVAPDQPNN